MSTAEEPIFVSVADYLVAEELATIKSDYIDGWVRAMSGGNVRHNRIKVNVVVCLSNQLEQHKPIAIIMRRTEKGFLRETVAGLDGTIELSILGLQLPLSEVYADVDFTATAIHESELSYEIE